MVLLYTSEEELWSQWQWVSFKSAYRSVPLGKDIVDEFVRHSLGEPVSSSFVPRSIAVFVERFLRVLQLHAEFAR